MVADRPTKPEQLSLEGLQKLPPEEEALQILREEYIRRNGDLRPFFAELSARSPKARDPRESWMVAGAILIKSAPTEG
jgi:hypothetical protein